MYSGAQLSINPAVPKLELASQWRRGLITQSQCFGFTKSGRVFAFLNRAQVMLMLMVRDHIENHCTNLALK